MFKNKKILVVVAHPDDEVLGVGATVYKLVHTYQAEVKVVILGEGLTARDQERDVKKRTDELEAHRQCIRTAQAVLGYQALEVHQLADNRFDSVDLLEIIKIVEQEKAAFNPDFIFTHHGGDLNVDHRRTFEAVLTATRPMQDEKVKGIFCFETFSSTEWSFNLDVRGFRPNFFVSFGAEALAAKKKAMASYHFESREYPHPRSALALESFARANGAKVGKDFVEAFELVRYND